MTEYLPDGIIINKTLGLGVGSGVRSESAIPRKFSKQEVVF